MAGHSGPGGSSTAQTQTKKIQFKIVKTMMLVSLLYVVLWAPGYLHNLIVNVYNTLEVGDVAFYYYNGSRTSLHLRQPIHLRH